MLEVEGREALRIAWSVVPDRHPGDPERDRLFGTDITLITSVAPNSSRLFSVAATFFGRRCR